MSLFDQLLFDEDSPIDCLDTQRDLYKRIGKANYAQRNASNMDAAT